MAGLYIHIPFCKQACSYCDFYFLTRQQLREPFVEALVREIHSYTDTPFSSEPISSVYLGGGTPSLLNEKQLTGIFTALDSVFDLQPLEITMELNPDDVTADYLNMIRGIGINRASMGVQSFDEDILNFMHRAHNRNEALKALELLQKTDFPAFTADLIYGNPGQDLEMLKADIEQLLVFDPPHISAYSLTVEPNTRLGRQVELGRINPPDDEEVAAHFELVQESLHRAGIVQYEVSNFSKPGKEALHNSNYWTHQNYLGLGPSAHSFWWSSNEAKRWKNRSDIRHYLEKPAQESIDEVEQLNLTTLAEERIMLGLRTVKGISVKNLREKYQYSLSRKQQNWIENQVEKRMLVFEEERLALTPEGLRISDMLVVDLLNRG
ncbi:MAG: radical SAM family heme chaperone HemW [Balneolaceae bacterium]|nr:MAG: radical SAM family heme chaperone HemW [Balneolaceae bacterium]